MKISLRKYCIIASILILNMIYPFSSCLAQSEEEMNMLRLFYNDKDLVISPTRYPKPISQTAENITVITSDEIEAMNAHTVAEVLDRVPGLFISTNRDFGAYSLLNIQGSEPRHTLVMVDDVPWNSINEGSAETITIPVGIIDRIEIIKGPASSAWGSSLGGVINIITRQTGKDKKPSGSVQASYGKSNSQDYRAELSGTAGKAGYYLYAGVQRSDGLVRTRSMDNESLYTKMDFAISDRVRTGVSVGINDSDTGFGEFPSSDINVNSGIQSVFVSPYINAKISDDLDLRLSAYYLRQDIGQLSNALGLGIVGAPGELYFKTGINEKAWGGKGQIVWTKNLNTVVLGIDFEKDEYDQVLRTGSFLQAYGAPPVSGYFPDNTKWAIYANDTINLNKWSITPGIRYDNESITGSFVSPSLGVTYKLSNETVLRGTVARGFSAPSLLWTSGGGLFLDSNPSLKHEEIWSYQAGAESAFPFMWLRLNLFFHDIKNSIAGEPLGGGPPAFNDIYINDGKVRRKGLEIEAETAPVYDFSLTGGFSYVDIDPPTASGSSGIYSYTLGIKYKKNTLSGQLFGYYNWYDHESIAGSSYDDFIWDININKEIHFDNKSFKLFFSAHNLFNGSQYSYIETINPRRWLEAGVKYRF